MNFRQSNNQKAFIDDSQSQWKKTKNVQKCKEEPEVKGGASQSLELYLVLPTKEKLPNPQ